MLQERTGQGRKTRKEQERHRMGTMKERSQVKVDNSKGKAIGADRGDNKEKVRDKGTDREGNIGKDTS